MSAYSLLNGTTANVIPNIQSNSSLYNPSIPVIGDQNIRSIRNINMKDRFYLDNAIDGQMKNNDGLSLGANNKFLRHRDYDRQIDANFLRRQNPRNKKHTDPDDFYNGSQLAYFEIPRKIPRAQIMDPLAAGAGIIDPMDAYQYKNRFISNTPTPQTKPAILPPMVSPTEKVKVSDSKLKPIGTDPTEDPNILAINNLFKNDREKSIKDREARIAEKPPGILDYDTKDEFGNPKYYE
jgi:hypothetical protein